MQIGILALQGDFEAHRKVLEELGANVVEVRDAADLENCDGLVIPGGESTTMSRLCDRYELWEPLRNRVQNGMGLFGTCAGLIFMAKEISGASKNFAQKTLGVLDVDVARNAYGAQLDSFETNLDANALGDQLNRTPLHAVFIRAPRITRVGPQVKVLAEHDGEPVAVASGRCVAVAFHPEIAGEMRLHQFWLELLKNQKPNS